MKRLIFTLVVLGGMMCCTAGKANITSATFQSDNDGAIINCPVYTWSGNVSDLSVPISGEQRWEPAHVVGTIDTTDATGDPTLTLSSSINNDTTFAWTAYIVNVYMNTTFVLSGAGVTVPGDWATAVTQPNWNGSQYEGQLYFTAGTPVTPGGNLDFAYTISFSGATSYSFTQEMIPVPEPGTVGFLAAGGLLLGGLATIRLRRNHLR